MLACQSARNALEVERRELALELVLEREIELDRLAGLAVAQGGPGLAEVVVAVVAEEDDLAADLGLQPPGRRILATRKRRGKNPHGCWPKQMTGLAVMASARASARAGPGPSAAWSTRLNSTQAAQPITLYQR